MQPEVPETGAMRHKMSVLLVDDQLMIVEAVRRMLAESSDIEFHYVTDGAKALDAAIQLQPTCILQDLVMPAIDGFQVIKQYRENESLRNTPVIVLSGNEDARLKAHGFSVGANDYMVKLPDRLEMMARVRYHSNAHISRLQRDEAFRFLRESQKQLADANIELQKLAALDSLTGIANRRRFDEAMKIEWQRGQREKKPLSLLMCDVDFFKKYNDHFGHVEGDMCLKKAAAVLTGNLKRPADLAARYGGEEFALVLPETDMAGAIKVAEACRENLEHLSIDHPGADCGKVTMSIGVATMVPDKDTTYTDLVNAADKALYAAKAAGRNCIKQG